MKLHLLFYYVSEDTKIIKEKRVEGKLIAIWKNINFKPFSFLRMWTHFSNLYY